ncbi:hypothetical protein HHK36_026154 [Tetracentron sinense]|uniref:Reticulon domain-containing protein n=1 Tax=Tetracentron sinense TaxID=13715 RepID=A0A834YI75_TETSI|nr:hypothetical protein HHK36_026154 [Tetracentron sinense]
MDYRTEVGKPLVVLICGSLVYYHCSYRNSSLLSLVSDVFIVLLCSLAILGLLFRQINISVPVDPLEWQISQETANGFVACWANTVGAAESVLRVAATGHDKRLFLKVVVILYLLSALGRLASGATIAYAALLAGFLRGIPIGIPCQLLHFQLSTWLLTYYVININGKCKPTGHSNFQIIRGSENHIRGFSVVEAEQHQEIIFNLQSSLNPLPPLQVSSAIKRLSSTMVGSSCLPKVIALKEEMGGNLNLQAEAKVETNQIEATEKDALE